MFKIGDKVVLQTNIFAHHAPLFTEGVVSDIWNHSGLIEVKCNNKLLVVHPKEISLKSESYWRCELLYKQAKIEVLSTIEGEKLFEMNLPLFDVANFLKNWETQDILIFDNYYDVEAVSVFHKKGSEEVTVALYAKIKPNQRKGESLK